MPVHSPRPLLLWDKSPPLSGSFLYFWTCFHRCQAVWPCPGDSGHLLSTLHNEEKSLAIAHVFLTALAGDFCYLSARDTSPMKPENMVVRTKKDITVSSAQRELVCEDPCRVARRPPAFPLHHRLSLPTLGSPIPNCIRGLRHLLWLQQHICWWESLICQEEDILTCPPALTDLEKTPPGLGIPWAENIYSSSFGGTCCGWPWLSTTNSNCICKTCKDILWGTIQVPHGVNIIENWCYVRINTLWNKSTVTNFLKPVGFKSAWVTLPRLTSAQSPACSQNSPRLALVLEKCRGCCLHNFETSRCTLNSEVVLNGISLRHLWALWAKSCGVLALKEYLCWNNF